MDDESGVNVLIEYILNFGTLLILLALVLLMYQTIITNSSNVIANEEYKIFANDIANRIVLFDGMASSTISQSGTIYTLELTFDTPDKIAGMAYTISIQEDSVTVSSAGGTPSVTAMFNTSNSVTPKIIIGSYAHHKISYVATNIEVV